MNMHWFKWCLVLGLGWLASAGCGSGEYTKRLEERMQQLRKASPFDEVLFDAIALGDSPVLIRVPRMCAKAWVENAEEKPGDEKSAGQPKPVDPGRVKPLLDDKPADNPNDPPVRNIVDMPGWTLIAYETLETVESSKSQVGCYWYFAVRKKDTIKAGEPDVVGIVGRQLFGDKYKMTSSKDVVKKQVQFADVQEKPVIWKDWVRCSGPMRFYYENEEGKATANPYLLKDGTLELYVREEGDYLMLFGWRAPTELAKKLEMPAIAEKVGGSVALSPSGGAPKAKSSPPSPPAVIAKETPPEGEKPKPEPGEIVPTPPKPDPTDPNEQRDLSIARMKQIGEAIQKYVQKNGRFPPATFAPEGQPHSWRVALLQHLGKTEEELYKRFRLNEGWDSDFNKKVAEQMPEIFKTPGGPAAPSTCYVAVLGPKTVFGLFGQREALTPTDVRDGVANTLVVVEANTDKAVPWNAPKDLEWNEPAPAFALGTLRGGNFLGLMGDGAVRPISTQLDAPTLNALCTAAGGEPIDLNRLESGVPAVPAEKPLIDLATAAFAAGREGDGFKYLMAEAVVTGNEEVLGSFRRSTALKRGALMLRWGIIVETSRPAAKPAAGGAVPPVVPAKPAEGEPKPDDVARFWHDNLVPAFRKALQERVGEGRFGPWLKDVPVDEPKAGEAVQRWPGIVVLAEPDGTKARDAAQAEGLDLAIVIEVTVLSGRGDQARAVAEVSLRDVVADRPLWHFKKKLNKNLVDPKKKSGSDLIDEAVGETMKAIDDTIRLEEFGQITPVQAATRAENLVKQATDPSKPVTAENKLPVLFELRFYAAKKLLTDEQLKGFYEKLLGNADEGKKLATGTPAERRAAVNNLLPQTPAK
jgi:hypothetical protein